MTQRFILLFLGVFVRKKKNKSGVISIQVIAKVNGKSKLLKTIGSSPDLQAIEEFVNKGKEYIQNYHGQQVLNFSDPKSVFRSVFAAVSSHKEVGTERLLGAIFNEIGFNKVEDSLFKYLVFSRLIQPVSKLKTTEYLFLYKEIEINSQQIYRYLDRLHSSQKELVQQISYLHTRKVLQDDISVVFYDVTTLYFEIDQEDDLRKTGFSKEGKHQNPQIVLGLLISKHGYPLAYEIFEGNKFEGHTMLPVIDAFKSKYNLDQLVVIADSGLLSKTNVQELQDKGYEFVLGGRIKNESRPIKQKILELALAHGQSAVIEKGDLRLIISYSDDRAKKDRYNREKGLKKLEKQIRRGKLTKSNINNRGYNKFLKLEGEISVAIDYDKLKQDACWDGLKGYLTNAKMNKDQVIENYQHLWQIESAFRVSKSDLRVRPIYHRLQRRIEAHICISFVAYKIHRELDRQLKERKAKISANTAIEIAKTIYSITANMPDGTELEHLLITNQRQKQLINIFPENFG